MRKFVVQQVNERIRSTTTGVTECEKALTEPEKNYSSSSIPSTSKTYAITTENESNGTDPAALDTVSNTTPSSLSDARETVSISRF